MESDGETLQLVQWAVEIQWKFLVEEASDENEAVKLLTWKQGPECPYGRRVG